ncbi:YoaK family protein [Pseudoalteromonas xiamenensis]|uniref:DUF1275 domain-containing protein n=1 Tax=Pseudoalteromonas xiamenensis TaxID=882626 RepID=A0A975DHZ9_9GAMM|nr:YoaK family protein [Pseudoalteromonas xiamenensis]QTH70656.1 DUF1275 domain-containing protein [Pseudoalteromonas xiamenensis]
MHTLPRWIVSGAFVLALNAGMVNSVGFLGFTHQAVSHVSGNATQLGIALNPFHSDLALVWNLTTVLLAFLIGAAISGTLLKGTQAKLGRHYDTLLLVEAIFLLIAGGLLYLELGGGYLFASAACGLQNAMVTNYSGAIVRTTHLTGVLTDMGLMIGARFRGETIDTRKARLFIALIVGFIVGGTLGAGLFSLFSYWVLAVAGVLSAILALTYRLFLAKSEPA